MNNDYKFCIHCGKKIKKDVRVCPFCHYNQVSNKPENGGSTQQSSSNNTDTSSTGSDSDHNQGNDHKDVTQDAKSKVDNVLQMKQQTQQEEQSNQQQMESLNLQERSYVNQEVADNAPSVGIAYLLWFFLWWLGIHHFYMHQTVAGVLMVINTFLLIWIFGLGAIINFVWALVDLFCIPMYVRHYKAKLKHRAITEVMMMRHGN